MVTHASIADGTTTRTIDATGTQAGHWGRAQPAAWMPREGADSAGARGALQALAQAGSMAAPVSVCGLSDATAIPREENRNDAEGTRGPWRGCVSSLRLKPLKVNVGRR